VWQRGKSGPPLVLIKKLIIVAILATVGSAGADVYTWVDEAGQVHYSDQWVPGCEKVEMPEFPTAVSPVSPPPPPISDAPPPRESAKTETSEEPVYKTLTVVSPREDECLRRTGQIVKVLVDIDPAPQKRKLLQHPGHRMRVRLNGTLLDSEFLIGRQDGSLALFLTEVFHGTHQLQVMIEDVDGQSLTQSQVVNFHVQQYSPIMRAKQLSEQIQPPVSPPSPSPP
jgi:hypothetical protein